MVDIIIYIKGGVLPHDNIAAQTIDNSTQLRESFYMLFSQLIDDVYWFNIILGAGYKNTVNFFKSAHSVNNKFLLIDLEKPKSQKSEKLKELDLENLNTVFFMVQEMEAWILSQPEKIDEYYSLKYKRKKLGDSIKNDKRLQSKHPEEICKPSSVLNIILKKYFSVEKRGKIKKKTYGKLKDAPELLSLLDAKVLKETFSDLSELINLINLYQLALPKSKDLTP